MTKIVVQLDVYVGLIYRWLPQPTYMQASNNVHLGTATVIIDTFTKV